ncbi:hypothetical protein [Streptomyces sp. NPDC086787]|uniref:hypothetical protein n=1 Tax=Streptomyces sp. NPDC086787 TaxID=3365759 RepID=UPI00381D02A9
MIQRRIVLLSAAGLASAFLLAACDSAADHAAPAANPGNAAPAARTPAAPATPAALTLTARTVDGVGSVVTDGTGMTLYRSTKDQAHPSRWTCAGACAKTWIPVIVRDPVRTTGVDSGLLGTVHRDGEKQLTLGGWPLYRYAGDTKAGQLNGQGDKRTWYAVTPTGT